MTSPEAPSYSASKSALTKFWEGLALENKKKNIHICNVRFGFVNTKMAKAPIRPFLLSKKVAALKIIKLINKPQIRLTTPKAILPLLLLIKFLTWLTFLIKN